MSVINQILNQLEQRGANTTLEESMVRAVPTAKRNFTMPLLAFGLALIAGIAVWQWMQMRKPSVAKAEIAQQQPALPDNPPTRSFAPASRMMMQLTSVPLPSSIRSSEPAASSSSGMALPVKDRTPKSKPIISAKSNKKRTKSRPAKAAPPKAIVAARVSSGASPFKQITPAQQADAEFRKAVKLMQQGQVTDAIAGYQTALRLDASHDAARQALVVLLMENRDSAEAERVLQERLKRKPDHTGFAMMLARIQLDRGEIGQATTTLQKTLPYANRQAEFQAFLAALLQRQHRNEDAARLYQSVTQLAPNNGVWLMGYGISLQAVQRDEDARKIFQKALDTQTLSADLREFVQKKLKQL